MAESVEDRFSHQYVLLAIARMKMEVGSYVEADEALEKVLQIFKDGGKFYRNKNSQIYFKLYCKYYHTLGKNKSRAYYFERAKEVFLEGINFINNYPKDPDFNLQDKYLCKLYEGIGLLYCEALWFEKSDDYYDMAEELYKTSKDIDAH